MLFNRKSIRLRDYDYSCPGEYYLAICTHNHECIFGSVINEKMKLSEAGVIADECWKDIPKHFHNITLDEYAVMPNHIHGIIVINEKVGVEYIQPLRNEYQHVIPNSVGSIVRSYKAAVSMICKKHYYSGFHWQRNYYEHIICSDRELNLIRDYIVNNPIDWYYGKNKKDF